MKPTAQITASSELSPTWALVFWLALSLALTGCGGSATAPDGPIRIVRQPAQAQPTPSGRIVAAGILQVRGRFITIEDIMSNLRRSKALARLPAGLSQEDYRRKATPIVAQAINVAINDGLILDEAELNLGENVEKIRRNYIEALTKAELSTIGGGSMEKLRDFYAAKGQNLDDEIMRKCNDELIRRYLQLKFAGAHNVTRRRMWDYYSKHIGDYTKSSPARVRIIAVPFQAFSKVGAGAATASQLSEAKKVARDRIAQAAQAARAGGNFGDIARRLAGEIRDYHGPAWRSALAQRGIYVKVMEARGGLWTMAQPAKFGVPEIAQALSQASPGQVSGVIESPGCYFLTKLDRAALKRVVSFEAAQDEIRALLQRRDLMDFHRKSIIALRADYDRLQGAQGRSTLERFLEMVVDRVIQDRRSE
ncbi:MAG: peptidyl-prolyl cis-trans isomerase [Planctomycetes bacterium]|nr:peptidyl-prolyl cis-trans isomerase [Planctomycetota bacterium]